MVGRESPPALRPRLERPSPRLSCGFGSAAMSEPVVRQSIAICPCAGERLSERRVERGRRSRHTESAAPHVELGACEEADEGRGLILHPSATSGSLRVPHKAPPAALRSRARQKPRSRTWIGALHLVDRMPPGRHAWAHREVAEGARLDPRFSAQAPRSSFALQDVGDVAGTATGTVTSDLDFHCPRLCAVFVETPRVEPDGPVRGRTASGDDLGMGGSPRSLMLGRGGRQRDRTSVGGTECLNRARV